MKILQKAAFKDTVSQGRSFLKTVEARRYTLKVVEYNPVRVGVIRSSSIGDVVLASSCISLLRAAIPEGKIYWMGRAPSLSLIQAAFPDIECLDMARTVKIQEMLLFLKDVDFLVDLQTNLRSKIIAHAFKNRFRKPIFSCPKNQLQRNRLVLEGRIYGRRRSLPSRALEPLKPQYQLMRDTLLSALQSAKLLAKDYKMPSGIVPAIPVAHYKGDGDKLSGLSTKRWIAVAPGASYEAKRAPLEVFVEAFQILKSFSDVPLDLGLVLLGDANDERICEEFAEKLGWQGPVINFAGKLSLWENAVMLQRAAICLVCNDSALGHIAEAVETPVLVLFGPTVEGFGFAPRMSESRAFSSRLGCRPCSKHGKAPCRFGDKLCFWEISRSEIADHMKGLIMKTTQERPLTNI